MTRKHFIKIENLGGQAMAERRAAFIADGQKQIDDAQEAVFQAWFKKWHRKLYNFVNPPNQLDLLEDRLKKSATLTLKGILLKLCAGDTSKTVQQLIDELEE